MSAPRNIALVLALLSTLTTLSAAETADRFSGVIDIGFDSFTEKYSIVEQDTVDNTIEFRTRIALGYLNGSLFRDFIQLEAQSTAGNNGIESIGKIKGAKSLSRSRIGFETGLTSKAFWEGTSYAYPNDYLRINGNAYYNRQLGAYSNVRISESIERLDFAIRNEYDYDYLKSSTSISADFLSPHATSIHAGLTTAHKSIPDSTEISYQAYAAAFEYRKNWNVYKQFSFMVFGERRSYAHEPARSPFWSTVSYLKAKPLIYEPWGLVLEHTLECYFYDTSTDIYFNYMENKFAVLFSYFRDYRFEAACGPLYAVLTSKQSGDDAYEEFGGKITLDYLDAGRVWFSMSYELGQRSYDSYQENPEEAIFSDYFFNRFNLFASWKIKQSVGFNGFVSYEPRNYQRAGDDISTTLFSMDVSYYF